MFSIKLMIVKRLYETITGITLPCESKPKGNMNEEVILKFLELQIWHPNSSWMFSVKVFSSWLFPNYFPKERIRKETGKKEEKEGIEKIRGENKEGRQGKSWGRIEEEQEHIMDVWYVWMLSR